MVLRYGSDFHHEFTKLPSPPARASLASYGDVARLDVNTRLQLDVCELLDQVLGSRCIDDTLVDAHGVAIPSRSTVSTWRLARRDLKLFGG